MNKRAYLVVSDKFAKFASDKNALTVSQVEAMLQMPPQVIRGPVFLIPGQGLSKKHVSGLVDRITTEDHLSARFDISHLTEWPERAEPALSHKHKPHNTLIGAPRRADDGVYHMNLLIDENCELMDDHQTGQHVQGMILVEAARQAFLAVTGAFFLTDCEQERYFVINSMDMTYENFVFPVAAHIEYRDIESDVNDRRARFTARIDFIQSGHVCAICRVKFTAYPDCFIAEKEAELASNVAQKTLARAMNGREGVAI